MIKNVHKAKKQGRIRRHRRIRSKIIGSVARPRLSVFRSSKHIWAQIIDDSTGRTLASASDKELKAKSKNTKVEKAALVGELIARKAKEKGISAAVFDRGGNKYHGRIAAVAEAARKAGLKL